MFKQKLNYSLSKRKLKLVCNSYPDRDQDFAALGFELKDDSLLNIERKVEGKTIPVSSLKTEDLENTPGIYVIRCLSNNKHFIGETQNIKNRIATRLKNLKKNIEKNKYFLDDFNKYGIENFELVLFQIGPGLCEDYLYRKFIEYKLQSELYKENLCYNKGFSERLQNKSQTQYNSSAGIYCIRCKINNACYFGESGQRRGIAGRLASWKSKLRKNESNNQILQNDWICYGKNAFEFIVIDSGPMWTDKEKRKQRETMLIRQHEDSGGLLYNTFDNINPRAPSCPLSLRDIIINNKSDEFRTYISNINRGRISLYRKPVIAEGNTYLTIDEAALSLSQTRNNIRQKIKTGVYSLASAEQVKLEEERRKYNSSSAIIKQTKKRSSGFSQKVWIEGTIYNSISDAARTKNVSVTAISNSLKKGRKGYFKLNKEGFKLDKDNHRIEESEEN